MKLSEKAFKKAVICLAIIGAIVALSGTALNDDTMFPAGMGILASTMVWIIIKALKDMEGTIQ